jgi:hypothetical protein
VVVVTAGAGAGAACVTGAGATVVVVVVDVVGGAVDVVEEVGASVLGALEAAWNRAGIDAEAERGGGWDVRPDSTTNKAMSAQLAMRTIGVSPAARARRAGGEGMGRGSRVQGVRAVAHIYPFRFPQTAKLHRRGK